MEYCSLLRSPESRDVTWVTWRNPKTWERSCWIFWSRVTKSNYCFTRWKSYSTHDRVAFDYRDVKNLSGWWTRDALTGCFKERLGRKKSCSPEIVNEAPGNVWPSKVKFHAQNPLIFWLVWPKNVLKFALLGCQLNLLFNLSTQKLLHPWPSSLMIMCYRIHIRVGEIIPLLWLCKPFK